MVPALILAALIGWQVVLAGHTLWLCAGAARAAAPLRRSGRARARRPAARCRGRSGEGCRSSGRTAARVSVEVRVPILLRAWQGPVRVSAVAALGSER